MNQENTRKLVESFPELYKQYYYDPMSTCMCWGFECGNGWFNLLYELSEKIVALDPNAEALQVKQKFGYLRFYINTTSEGVQDLIDEYSDKSANTCEHCGTTENVEFNHCGWIVPLCPQCKLTLSK